MISSLYTVIAKAKSLDSHERKISLIENWTKDQEVETLPVSVFTKIAEFVDGLLEGFSPWPSLLADGAHSCYVEKKTLLIVLKIAKLNYDSANLAHFLGELHKEKHFLTLAFKWHSLAAYLGNELSVNRITELYASNKGLVKLVPFAISRELFFHLPSHLTIKILKRLQMEIEHNFIRGRVPKAKIEKLRKARQKYLTYRIFFQLNSGGVCKKKDLIEAVELNFAEEFSKLKQDLNFAPTSGCFHKAMIGFLSLAFAFREHSKETFEEELEVILRRDKNNEEYAKKFKSRLISCYKLAGLFDVQRVDEWVVSGRVEEEKAALYLLRHINELSKDKLRLFFGYMSNAKKHSVVRAFLVLAQKEGFPSYKQEIDAKTVLFVLRKCLDENVLETHYSSQRDVVRYLARENYGTKPLDSENYIFCRIDGVDVEPCELDSIDNDFPVVFRSFSKRCVIWFSKKGKIKELAQFIGAIGYYWPFASELLELSSFSCLVRKRKRRYDDDELLFICELGKSATATNQVISIIVRHLYEEETPVSRKCLEQLEDLGIDVEEFKPRIYCW